MIIDFHTHVFPDKIAKSTIDALAKNSTSVPHTDGTVNGMVEAMNRADVDICVTLPVLTKPTQFDSVARYAIEINKTFSDCKRKLISFAGMHPQCDDIEGKMSFLKENGILGVKIHPDYQSTYIDDEGYIKIIECAKRNDMVVVTHSGVDDGYKGQPVRCTVDRVLKVIEKTGHSKFVLAHFGAHRLWEEVYEKLCGLDVYFDTAYTFNDISKDLFEKIVNKHGADKILFATDCPWREIKEDLDILRSYNLDSTIMDKILYKNALKLLKIKE